MSIHLRVGLLLVMASLPAFAAAADPIPDRCSDPIQDASGMLTIQDCLFILRAAVGTVTCDPECICDPGLRSGITTEDALVCLQRSVGTNVPLDCRCAWETTRVEDISEWDGYLSFQQTPWYGFCPWENIESAYIRREPTGEFHLQMDLLDDASQCFFQCFEGDFGFSCSSDFSSDIYGECPCVVPGPSRLLSEDEVEDLRSVLRRFEVDDAADEWCWAADPSAGFYISVGPYEFHDPSCSVPQITGGQISRILDLLVQLRDAE